MSTMNYCYDECANIKWISILALKQFDTTKDTTQPSSLKVKTWEHLLTWTCFQQFGIRDHEIIGVFLCLAGMTWLWACC